MPAITFASFGTVFDPSIEIREYGAFDMIVVPYSRFSLNGMGGAPPEKYHLEREYHLGLGTLGYCEYPTGSAGYSQYPNLPENQLKNSTVPASVGSRENTI
jgi:hypothetical protein